MEHQVLARKWRPRIFKEMVGQEHVLKALINALDHNRLHHAYLFTGTRGVGKTTIARILAKCLNCEKGITSEPCEQCSSCVEINEGRCIDLIEVDAASRTKVEDTRELLDNVQYLPTRARFKVYLIDEVHMLSGHSFNALLKTLEEPPEHVKFLLATTDPQKLPVTILSRCLQFNLKNMSPERIAEHLQFVLGEEQIQFEEPALWQLGRAADGSMRDALSLTDQAIAFGDNSVMETDVSTMLGSIDRGRIQQILDALLQKNATEVLNQINELAEFSPDFSTVLEELISLLHRIAVVQMVPDSVTGDETLAQKLRDYAAQVTAEDLQLYYQIALIGRRDLPLNPSPKAGLEMVLLRMLAFSPVDSDQPEAPKKKLTTSPAESTQRPVSQPQPSAALTQPTAMASPQAVPSPQSGQSKAAQALAMARGETRADSQPKTAGRAKLDLVVDNDIAGLAEIAAIPNKADSEPDYYADETSKSQPQSPRQSSPERKPDFSPSVAAPERVPAEVSTTPEKSQEPAPSSAPVERFPLADLNTNDDWIKVVFQTPLRGMTRNILMQCAFESRVDAQISLKVDPQYIDLLNASHESRIEQALTETLDAAIKMTVKAGAVDVETPAVWDQRVNAERLQAARESLENDENVQCWVAEFGATLDIDSIKPIDK
jgi:DNA polymerase III subunit gamma/tau